MELQCAHSIYCGGGQRKATTLIPEKNTASRQREGPECVPVIHCGSGHGQHSHMRVHCSWLGAVRKRAVQQRLNHLRQELSDKNAMRVWWLLNAVRERAVQSRVTTCSNSFATRFSMVAQCCEETRRPTAPLSLSAIISVFGLFGSAVAQRIG